MRKRLEALKKDQKGFTLVELIVVLVILAILAALLVPALLGYIDKAKNSKYLEEARSIFTAIQAVNDEQYAKPSGTRYATVAAATTDIENLISPTIANGGDIHYYSDTATDKHKYFSVKYIENLTFTSQDGTKVKVSMDTDGSWKTDDMETGTGAW